MALTRQLEELQLIQCSLLPGENFTFILPAEDAACWNSLVEAFDTTPRDVFPSSQARFEIKVTGAKVWFEIELPHVYPEVGSNPQISIKGEDISRNEQEHWQEVMREKMAELVGTEYKVYQLISILVPMLHDDMESSAEKSKSTLPAILSSPSPARRFHVLFTSHHLVSPNKRRSLQQWSSELSVSGFAKVGYPGVIYAEGEKENVKEFVTNVKSMQWLALKVRFVEPLNQDEGECTSIKQWKELQKVGQVVEEMRKRGREQYITEMGIGGTAGGRPESN